MGDASDRERGLDRRPNPLADAGLGSRIRRIIGRSGLAGFAIVGGALAAGPDVGIESLVRLAGAWLVCVPLGAGAWALDGPRNVSERAADARSAGGPFHDQDFLVLVTRLVIAWFLGGVALAVALALTIVERIRSIERIRTPLDGVVRAFESARPALAGVLLPALLAWAALGGPTPVPAPFRIDSGALAELGALVAANWVVPVVFAGVAAASARAERLGAAAGLFVAATALASTDRIVGAAIFGLAIAGGLAVDGAARRRPFGTLLIAAGLALLG